ncbi:MAG: energy transducer TonB [Methylococcales bacterium]|nr:MAG: energy transducer TonB [Methylococcales bacterium]
MITRIIFTRNRTVLNNKDVLLIATAAAVFFHLVMVIAWSLSAEDVQPERIATPIDVTLISAPSEKIDDKAEFLAQDNQSGGGRKASQAESPAQQAASNNGQQKSNPIKKVDHDGHKTKAAQRILTSDKAERKAVSAKKPADFNEAQQHPKLTADLLQQQIAQLGTEIRQSQPSSEQAKIKFVDAVSAHKYIAAQYMKDWENKVERTGNLNYPEIALKKDFSGTLTMDVGINADGSIYSIRIGKSSGNLGLDEAAKKIVRMSAPFAPLPLDLRKEVDILVITRVWKFSDESGLVTQ